MEMFINLKMNINRRGSYILEASIILPLLIICICSLIMIIKIIAICEDVTFITSKHLMNAALNYYNKINEISLCTKIQNEIKEVTDFEIVQYRYLFKNGSNDNLISLKAKANFCVYNPIGINSEIEFDEQVLCRGFAGKYRNSVILSEEEFSNYKKASKVYVFSKYGEKYHSVNCRYINQSDTERAYIIPMDREDAFRKGYTPCIICKGAAYE